ncbi:MAG: HEAT repeat domain-containing protein [Methanoregula sp.]|nr:HEAT repeat domain-containing protein [Methanoregula sp.]
MTDIEALKNAQDIRGLIRLLDHGKSDVQWRAADALGTMGEKACDPLLMLLTFHRVNVRIGAIEALGAIKSPRSVEPLIRTLASDEIDEVRWVAALALGEIGDKRAIPPLIQTLRDGDRYVRYGSVQSLKKLNWQPEDDNNRAYSLIALQDWVSIKKLGQAAVGPLIEMLKDQNPATRARIIDVLGMMRGADATRACETALMDSDPDVRWTAVLGAKKCGVTNTRLPLVLSKRPWITPSPAGAAVLNFLFFGSGYMYLGKWWGGLVFMSYMTAMVFIQLFTGVIFPFIYAYPFTWISAVHTYYMVKQMHDL